MPLVSASNETQVKLCLKFPGVPLKIAGRRPAIFQIKYLKKITYQKYALGWCFKRNHEIIISTSINIIHFTQASLAQ